MKVTIHIILLFIGFGTVGLGQNNYIFNGGSSSGFNHASIDISTNNSIFSGSENDGFDQNNYAQITKKWNGGNEDGFSFSFLDMQNINPIFLGSIDDGMAFMTFSMNSNSKLFYGGLDDGFSFSKLEGIDNSLVYSGGEGDGFSASGISKLIWDGDISKDWLMADNWNIPIVPTMNHSVCIPSGVPNYPRLTSLLGISIFEDHTYACSDLTILAGAQLDGIKNVNIIVNGELIVAGDMFLYTQGLVGIEARAEGLIKVLTGGAIVID